MIYCLMWKIFHDMYARFCNDHGFVPFVYESLLKYFCQGDNAVLS